MIEILVVIYLLVYNGRLYFQDWSYHVHCAGWPLSASSWEPEQNLTRDVVESYDHPTGITNERIDFGRETFLLALQHYLQGQTAQNHPFEAYINFDVFISCSRQRRQLQLLSAGTKHTSVATLMGQTCLFGGIAL